MRKRLALLGAGLCLSGSLVSAGAPAAVAQSNGKVVTLTYWAGFTGGDKPTYVRLVNLFNSTHPDIKVDMTIEPWDTIVPEVATGHGLGRRSLISRHPTTTSERSGSTSNKA